MAVTKKDASIKPTEVPSTGTHVVAVVVGEETMGYLPNHGSGLDRAPSPERARKMDAKATESLAGMWNAHAERAKLPERYEARLVEDLFAGEGA